LYDHRGIWRNKTYQTYKSKVKVFLNWLGPRKLDSLAINDFFIELSQKRHRTTYNTYRRTLKKILPAIGYNGLLENIHKLKTSTTPAKYFQRHQAKRLKTYLKDNDPELLFFCEFVYYCFLRPNSELRLLKVGDVDLDRWCIRVPGKVSKNWKNQYVTIPLPFREKVKEELFYKHSSEWLFPGRFDQSKPIGTNSMMGRHRKVLRQLGFGKEYKLYSWKHTGAVACVQAGINIKQLQIQLRHENLETVDKYLRQLGIHDLHDLERLFPPI
jgi:integrase